MSLATERAKFLRFALSVSVVSQNATLPVAFSAPSYRCRLAVACITAILYHTRSVAYRQMHRRAAAHRNTMNGWPSGPRKRRD